MKKIKLMSPLYVTLFICVVIAMIACGSNENDDPEIKVSPSVELLGTVGSNTTITVNVPNDVTWTISGVPEWLSCNKSGLGISQVVITATQENFSDEERQATLLFTTDGGETSASCIVTQKGVLAANCRVEITDMTIMSDGFAGDLSFDSNCKGYREAYFYAKDLPSLTERDVFAALMKKQEYSGSVQYFVSPFISPTSNPQAEIVYCIAAYGSETNPDGTHKYGRMTMKTVKTKPKTLSSDMSMTLSVTPSTWKVITSRQGSYGQKCEYYYYIAGEGSGAVELYEDWLGATDAFFTHFYFKPAIETSPDDYFLNGPQTLTFNRSADKFCCITWGTNKDTGEYSSELVGVWYPSEMKSSVMMKNDTKLNVLSDGSIPSYRKYASKDDMPKLKVTRSIVK